MKTSRCFVLMIAFLVQIVGCNLLQSANGPVKGNLDRSGAARLIRNSEYFRTPKTLWVEMKSMWSCDFKHDELRQLQRIGLVSLRTVRLQGDYCEAELTQEGRRQSSQWKAAETPLGGRPTWTIPIADRELVEITGIIGADKEQAAVEYTWKWVPNNVGRELPGKYVDLEPQKNQATFRKYDDGWRMTN